MLDPLARAHLIQQPGRAGTACMTCCAPTPANSPRRDGQEERQAALTRLFDYYLHTAAAAMDTLYPAERHRRPRIPPPATPVPPVAGTDRGAGLAGRRTGAPGGGHAYTLPGTAGPPTPPAWPPPCSVTSSSGGYYPETITIHSHARAAARRTGDRAAEATALNHWPGVYWRQGRYQQAADYLRQALALFRQAGDRAGQARALGNLGQVQRCPGPLPGGHDSLPAGPGIFRQTGDLTGKANALNNLGNSEERQGSYDLAARHARQSLAIARKNGDRNTNARRADQPGDRRHAARRRYQQAAGYLDQALAMCRRDRQPGPEPRHSPGPATSACGRATPGRPCGTMQEALALHREIGDRSGEADALNSLGEALLAAGQPAARTHYAAAFGIASRERDKYQQARAHHGLG